jgi:hypothetical protein
MTASAGAGPPADIHYPYGWTHGAIAQLGERLHGMQEVVGSSPTSSIGRGYGIPAVTDDIVRTVRARLAP